MLRCYWSKIQKLWVFFSITCSRTAFLYLQPIFSVFLQFVQNCGYILFFCSLCICSVMSSSVSCFFSHINHLWCCCNDCHLIHKYTQTLWAIYSFTLNTRLRHISKAPNLISSCHTSSTTYKTAIRGYKRIQIPATYMNYPCFRCNKKTDSLKQISRAMFWVSTLFCR